MVSAEAAARVSVAEKRVAEAQVRVSGGGEQNSGRPLGAGECLELEMVHHEFGSGCGGAVQGREQETPDRRQRKCFECSGGACGGGMTVKLRRRSAKGGGYATAL